MTKLHLSIQKSLLARCTAFVLFGLLVGASALQLAGGVPEVFLGPGCRSACLSDTDCTGVLCSICLGSNPDTGQRGLCEAIN